MDNPLVSIIVPVYNAEKYLDRCIESIVHQDYDNFELIMVDDGSADQSSRIISEWKKKDGRIHIVRKENGGQSGARNSGIECARGDYLTFIDADDSVSEDYLSYLLSLFVPDCLVTECNHYVVRGDKRKANSTAGDRVLNKKEAFEEVLFHGCIDVAPWGKIYKREVFNHIRFPEGRIFEDTWIFGEILNETKYVAYGSRCCYRYYINDQSTVRKAFTPQNLQYIEAAQKLAFEALKCGDDMKIGGIRRINHARLSVLRYMKNCDVVFFNIREELRDQILDESKFFIHHPRTPRRDKMAVLLLKLGFRPFYFGWEQYSHNRNG